MRVLVVMQHVNFYRNLDTLVRELDARGHGMVVLHGTRMDDPEVVRKLARKRAKMVFMGRGIDVAQSELPELVVGYRPEPAGRWHKGLRAGRLVINRTIYLRKWHPSPERVTEALDNRLPSLARKCIQSRLGGAVLGRRFILTLWRWIESVSPPSRAVVAAIENVRPDVVLVSPMIWPKEPIEADYIRAARALGIPTIGYLNSWDNLTSKGTVHILPDLFIVWNEPLAQEAEEIHDVPRDVIRVTGAPHLDRFFDLSPSLTRAAILELMDCASDRPCVVYLCSSRTLIDSELDIVTTLADALAQQFPAGPPTLVVRPHPVNPSPWVGYAHSGVVVYPKHGDQADSPESWQEYYNQLSTASCFVGLNTTAFLEAVIVDRPCLTIVADEFYRVQGWTGHFRHLIHADFLEVSSDVAEVARRVKRILEGADEKADGRRAFAQWFLRPGGNETPATAALADMVERLAAPGSAAGPSPGALATEAPSLALAAKEEAR